MVLLLIYTITAFSVGMFLGIGLSRGVFKYLIRHKWNFIIDNSSIFPCKTIRAVSGNITGTMCHAVRRQMLLNKHRKYAIPLPEEYNEEEEEKRTYEIGQWQGD